MRKSEQLFESVRGACAKTLSNGSASGRDAVSACFSECYGIIRKAHFDGMGGLAVCRAHSLAVDKLIEYLYGEFLARRASRDRHLANKFCIIALGGYGRSELSPKSDIDLLLLYDIGLSDRLKTPPIDKIIYPMWDTGLKMSYSTRTCREALADARKDILLRNSMLDARFICGEKSLFLRFESRLNAFCALRKKEHFNELMRLKYERHCKYGWTPYLQEPNIKNGIGGLRDAQTMAWKTRLNFGSPNIRELAARGIISFVEYKAVRRAYDFLLRVRNDLHYLFERENDLLDLETQPKVAEHLGFLEGGENERVENFMRKVYYSFRAIDSVAKTSRKRMGLALPGDISAMMRRMPSHLPRNRKFHIGGFTFYRGEVFAANPEIFREDPTLLVKVFSYFQEFDSVPSERLEVLIKDSRHLIDDAVRADRETNAVFLSILQARGNAFPALERMHYWGVLNAFVPDFREITCLVQHEFYHRYTADVHILNTIAQLDKIFCACSGDELYWEYHKVLISTPSAVLAYLMLFLHDIGKGDGIRGHAEVGAEIGDRLLRRFGVPDSDIELVLFVVKNHLAMARFWQSYDVEDETSVSKFAAFIENEEQLKYLYVITFCDAMGTTEGFWNSYKQSLHTALYNSTLAYLQKEESQRTDSMERRKLRVFNEALSDPNAKGLESLIVDHIKNLPRNYFSFHGRNDLIMHVKMINRLLKNIEAHPERNMPVIEWRDEPNRSLTRLYVVSAAEGGLFATLAGVMTLSGLDILGSKILTRSDGITLDAFYVRGISSGVADNPRVRDRFAADVAAALSGKTSIDERVDEMFYADERRRGQAVISDVFMRRESGKFVLEIRARDRMGLLYKIARTIDSCGYNVVFARVNTELNWAQDTFHLMPRALAESSDYLLKSLKDLM